MRDIPAELKIRKGSSVVEVATGGNEFDERIKV